MTGWDAIGSGSMPRGGPTQNYPVSQPLVPLHRFVGSLVPPAGGGDLDLKVFEL